MAKFVRLTVENKFYGKTENRSPHARYLGVGGISCRGMVRTEHAQNRCIVQDTAPIAYDMSKGSRDHDRDRHSLYGTDWTWTVYWPFRANYPFHKNGNGRVL